MAGWDNPDVGLLLEINGLAKHTPEWTDRAVAFLGEYGLVAAVVGLVLYGWWSARRRLRRDDAATAVAGVLWAPLAAGVAWLVNLPIRQFVERPRPFATYDGIAVPAGTETGFAFVSGPVTVAMAVAVGLFMVSRRIGLIGIGVAVLQGLSRIYLGVNYPTDVLGGLALGTAAALLLAPGGMAVLGWPVRKVAGTRAGWLVQARRSRRGGWEQTGSERGRDTGPAEHAGTATMAGAGGRGAGGTGEASCAEQSGDRGLAA